MGRTPRSLVKSLSRLAALPSYDASFRSRPQNGDGAVRSHHFAAASANSMMRRAVLRLTLLVSPLFR